jgi:hypothetical protein
MEPGVLEKAALQIHEHEHGGHARYFDLSAPVARGVPARGRPFA